MRVYKAKTLPDARNPGWQKIITELARNTEHRTFRFEPVVTDDGTARLNVYIDLPGKASW